MSGKKSQKLHVIQVEQFTAVIQNILKKIIKQHIQPLSM
jgi:hypothetical protein